MRVLIGMAAIALTLPALAQSGAELRDGETLLEVQGVGETMVAPDAASLNIGVVSTGTTAKEATDANAAQMTRVIAAIRKAGIEQRRIRTQQISVQPRFARTAPSDFQGEARITGYVANNSIIVMVTDIERAPTVVTAAFDAGANVVNGPQLTLLDDEAAVSSARKDAVADARRAADEYAANLGMRVSRIIRFSERGRMLDRAAGGERYRIEPVSGASYAATPMPITGGEMRQRVTIWVDIALTRK